MDNQALLFLDVDGVLNGHNWHEGAQSNTIRRTCIEALNLILKQARPKIVISSAWRYMLLCGAMRPHGFEYLLRTHGACGVAGNVVGTTCADEDCAHCGQARRRNYGIFRRRPGKRRVKFDADNYPVCARCEKRSTRGDQIARYLREHGPPAAYVVLDDEDFGITAAGHPLVQTDGAVGLTERDARKAVRLLRRQGGAKC